MSDKELKAYDGNGTFIFVSYSHHDKDIVYDVIKKLQEQQIRIWFDEGLYGEIKSSDNERLDQWIKQVEDRIKRDKCRGVLYMISKNVLKYREAIIREIEIVEKYNKSYFALDLENSEDLYSFIDDFFSYEKAKIKKDDEDFKKRKKQLIKDNQIFLSEFPDDKICRKYREENKSGYRKIIAEFKEWGYDEGTGFPNGNVKHNGHIEYFPSIIEATPYNFIYFLISREKRGLAESLQEFYMPYKNKRHVWEGFLAKSFLDEDFTGIQEADNMGLLISMKLDEINNIKLILDKWKNYRNSNPLIINIYVESDEFENSTERIKKVLLGLDWEQKISNMNEEINSLILIQTDEFCPRQNSDNVNFENIRNRLENWRILLSDKYYFETVLEESENKGIKYLLHQFFQDSEELKYLKADRRFLEHWDRERFRKHKYEWETETDV